jgi:hypothetical protein
MLKSCLELFTGWWFGMSASICHFMELTFLIDFGSFGCAFIYFDVI